MFPATAHIAFAGIVRRTLIVTKWILKNSDESENINWILANSKACPECKRPIQKNDGCMHMTCRPPCRHAFCWLCLAPWTKHGYDGPCNRYNEKEKKDGTEKRRKMAKQLIDRYTAKGGWRFEANARCEYGEAGKKSMPDSITAQVHNRGLATDN
ncbi:hypothetical protein IFM89_023466 [Coptis chinensis]|uniref:RBR-type E3 ubiquitin transferase n=1 Tax=Coptis chinensis TaxID=261450 RepID=A0A835HF35_9MAGN|nr:hypothetical protein IFM89_023466 [Coptis chinensis]